VDLDQAFQELSLDSDAPAEAIRKAHRARARDQHPDHDGDVEGMQRLNEARDLALRHAEELTATPTQELVLRQMLDLERRRDQRESAQERGRELVATTASIELGRLRRTQRTASAFAVGTAALAAISALVKVLIPSPGRNAYLYLATFALMAIAAGLYRTVLAERISQIQFAIDDLGSALMRRPTFASTFRQISEGLLDVDDFEEMELELAVRFWFRSDHRDHQIEWLEEELADGLLEGPDPAVTPGSVLTLRDIARRGQMHGYPQRRIFDALSGLALRGELVVHRSERGICCHVAAVLKSASRHRGERSSIPWNELFEAIEILGPVPGRDREYGWRSESPLARLRRPLLFFTSHQEASVSDKFRRLARRIGVVDVTRLLIGKGLENRLLADRESLDRYRELMTTYRFALQAGETAEAQDPPG
jgi:hypothetical protein